MTTPSLSPPSDSSDPETDMRAPERPIEDQAPERRSILSVTRTGLAASVACHAVFILWAVGIWDSARPLAAMPPHSIAVDLVPSQDAPGEPQPSTPPEPEQQADTALPDMLQPTATLDPARQAPVPSGPTPPPELAPSSLDGTVALATRLAQSLALPVVLPGGGVDTMAADTTAELASDVVAEFKAHLRKCWSAAPNPAASPRLRILIRVAFKRDGSLLKEPMLIQAIASPDGPGLVKNAMKALQDCQPYAFMPADKYDEWKVIDITFSPQGVM